MSETFRKYTCRKGRIENSKIVKLVIIVFRETSVHCYRNKMDLSKYKVTQLKAVLQEQQLPTTGSKAELIARIQAPDPEENLIHRLEELSEVQQNVDEGTAQELPRGIEVRSLDIIVVQKMQ